MTGTQIPNSRERIVMRELFGEMLTARMTDFPQGTQVTVCGGTLPHIGSVSVVSPDGRVTTTEFPGHRDGVVSAKWAGVLAACGRCPAVVVAGIHYDQISKAQIGRIAEVTDEMLRELLETADGSGQAGVFPADQDVDHDRCAEDGRDGADAEFGRSEQDTREQVAGQTEDRSAQETGGNHPQRICCSEQSLYEVGDGDSDEGDRPGKGGDTGG